MSLPSPIFLKKISSTTKGLMFINTDLGMDYAFGSQNLKKNQSTDLASCIDLIFVAPRTSWPVS